MDDAWDGPGASDMSSAVKELHRQLGKERTLHDLMQEIKVGCSGAVWPAPLAF